MHSQPLARETLLDLKRIENWRGLAAILWTWSWIAGAFAIYIVFPHPLTAAAGIIVVSGRQLSLAVLMHEGAHRLLLRNKRANDWVSQVFLAYPLLFDTFAYRRVHLQHHKHTWTKDDPDLWLAEAFPVSRRSFARKIARDLLGIAGLRRYVFLFTHYNPKTAPFWGWLGWSALLVGVFFACGAPEGFFLLWVLPSLTGFSLVTRLRNIAEHAVVGDPADELRQTRTTLAPWWVRFLIAPNNVGYHLEHHLYLYVPHYNLPRLHRELMASGALDDAEIAHGYREVWRLARSA